MPATWNNIEDLIAGDGHLDILALRSGASVEALDALERHLGVALPQSVREFLAVHDGQERSATGLFFHSMFLGTAEIAGQWDNWRSIDEVAMNEDCADFMTSEPKCVIKPMYTNRLWIPLTHDGGGNHAGLDFDPDTGGQPGQVIAFGRDLDTKRLVAPNFETFIDLFAMHLRSGIWTLGEKGWHCPPGTRAWI